MKHTLMALGAAALVGIAPSPARSQAPSPRESPPADARLWVDGFLSRYEIDASPTRTRLPAAGGRVMWWLAPPELEEEASHLRRLAGRVAVGAFVIGPAGDAGAPRLRHVGAQVDARPLARPLFGRLDPLLTLGAGSMRLVHRVALDRDALLPAPPPPLLPGFPAPATPPPPIPRAERATRGTTLAPGVGARLRILPGLIVRADARRLLLAGPLDQHGIELSAGLSWSR